MENEVPENELMSQSYDSKSNPDVTSQFHQASRTPSTSHWRKLPHLRVPEKTAGPKFYVPRRTVGSNTDRKKEVEINEDQLRKLTNSTDENKPVQSPVSARHNSKANKQIGKEAGESTDSGVCVDTSPRTEFTSSSRYPPKAVVKTDLKQNPLFNKQQKEHNEAVNDNKALRAVKANSFTEEMSSSCQRSKSFPLKRATIDNHDIKRRNGQRPSTTDNVQFRLEDTIPKIANCKVYRTGKGAVSSNSSGFNDIETSEQNPSDGVYDVADEDDEDEGEGERCNRDTVVRGGRNDPEDSGDDNSDEEDYFGGGQRNDTVCDSRSGAEEVDGTAPLPAIRRSSTLISPDEQQFCRTRSAAVRPQSSHAKESMSFILVEPDEEQEPRKERPTLREGEDPNDHLIPRGSDTDSGRGSLGRTGSNTSQSSAVLSVFRAGFIYGDENKSESGTKSVRSTDEPSLPESYNRLGKLAEERKHTILHDESIPEFLPGGEEEQDHENISESSSSLTAGLKRQNSSLEEDEDNDRASTIRDSDSNGGSEPSTGENTPETPRRPVVGRKGRNSCGAVGSASGRLGVPPGAERGRKSSALYRRPTLMVKQTLWIESEVVKKSGVVTHLKSDEIKLNEALYEIFMTENSYWKHLGVAIEVFLNTLEKMCETIKNGICTKYELQKLFSNMRQLMDLSDKLLSRIHETQGEQITMQNFMPDLTQFLTEYFPVPYRAYASKRAEQEKTLKKLMNNKAFVDATYAMQCDPRCQGQDLKSYLCGPIQKVTRFHILIEKVLTYSTRLVETQTNSQQSLEMRKKYKSIMVNSEEALCAAKKLAFDCNNVDTKMRQIEKVIEIQQKLDVPSSGGGRSRKDAAEPRLKLMQNQETAKNCFLMKEGELTQITGKGIVAVTKTNKIYCFRFNEYAIISVPTDKNSRFIVKYVVTEMEARHGAEFMKESFTQTLGNQPPTFWHKCIQLVCRKSCEAKEVTEDVNISERLRTVGKEKRFLFFFNTDSDKERWIDAFNGDASYHRPSIDLPDGNWFKANKFYEAREPDELTVYFNYLVRSLGPKREKWLKCMVVNNEKLKIGWLPTDILDPYNDKNCNQEQKLIRNLENAARRDQEENQ
ncbi:uncharacterized protein LOC134842353 isoform X2 [Symsagittifera roscoffensis]